MFASFHIRGRHIGLTNEQQRVLPKTKARQMGTTDACAYGLRSSEDLVTSSLPSVARRHS